MGLRVAVFTGTRADYGLLKPLLRELKTIAELEVKLIVAGSHLSMDFGHTVNEIEADGFQIDDRVEMLLSSSSKIGVAKSAGLGLIGFAESLDRLKPDMLVVLGDRYEALAIAQAALLLEIPIAHIHGGEISEGSTDDAMRHMITKASVLHCVSSEQHRQRVIQLGEAPNRVFNVGALVTDQALIESSISREELSLAFDFDFSKSYCLLTYHPAGFAGEDPEATIKNILVSLASEPEIGIVATYPNADAGGKAIVEQLTEASHKMGNRMLLVKSLGIARYLSAMRTAEFVIGNSSSGIIEAPFLLTPTVNVGRRQQGRLAANSVINCEVSPEQISAGIGAARAVDWTEVSNPYYVGCSPSRKIVETLIDCQVGTGKKFFDLPDVSQWSK